jgi:hypothetical protein
MKVTMTAHADTRYSFAPQFLVASAIFARKATEIERVDGATATEDAMAEHRGCVVGALLQCVAALETEIHDLMVYGPGAHLGSGATDHDAREFLYPCAEMIDCEDVISRYEIVSHLLKRPKLSRGTQPTQDTALLIRLRNEIVHYKSGWGREMERSTLLTALQNLKHAKPPFVDDRSNFFPQKCLSATCAAWAVRTAVAFVDAFYAGLGVASHLDAYRSRLVV